jgi:hypothetical protein
MCHRWPFRALSYTTARSCRLHVDSTASVPVRDGKTMEDMGTVAFMAPADTTTSADMARSELDEKIDDAITEYTDRVRNDRAYEDTITPDELRHRYDT